MNEQKNKWQREYRLRKRLGLPQPKRGEHFRKHGLTGSTEHQSWLYMLTRCIWGGPQRAGYKSYKGKGISVCERWLDFENFLADMGPKPSPDYTLDRIDSNGNYEPNNCRWATRKQQARNWANRNRRISFRGENLPISEWSERLGFRPTCLSQRLDAGWSIERALTTPPRTPAPNSKEVI